MNFKEAFKIFELDENSSPSEIKIQYRRLLKIWHPDKNPDDDDLKCFSGNKTKFINNAYSVIKAHLNIKDNYINKKS